MDHREILREQFPSQIILKRFEETFRKREKVFQVSENTTKIRFEFSGCYSYISKEGAWPQKELDSGLVEMEPIRLKEVGEAQLRVE